MPIYEFYCSDCHRVYSFLSKLVSTEKRPACPRCGRPELVRRVSSFAISKGRKEPEVTGGPPDMDAARMEKAMESLVQEAEGIDEDNPRQAAHLMRKLFDATGMPVPAGMHEAIRRMEAGEDPQKIEEEMGDALGADPGEAGDLSEAEPRKGLSGLRRRALPPSVDPGLHEM